MAEEEKKVQENNTEAENEKIRKSNFNKIVIIFFLILFILKLDFYISTNHFT